MTNTCISHPCKRKSIYGRVGHNKTHCEVHKEDDMVDLRGDKCVVATCNHFRSWGFPRHKSSHCGDCGKKEMGMVNLKRKICVEETVGSTKKSRTSDDIDISKRVLASNLTCAVFLCGRPRLYGFQDQKASHCAEHGKLFGLVKVMGNLCSWEGGCYICACYGLPGKAATHCVTHKEIGMIDVVNKSCAVDECNDRVSHGFPGKTATHCSTHGKEIGMIDVVSSRCAECARVQVKRKGDLCATCDVEVNGATRKIRVKEKDMVAALQYILELGVSIHGIEVRYDESIGKAYGSYRPDIHINCGTFIIVIECDEFQHLSRYFTTIKRKIGADGAEILATEGREVSKYGNALEVKRMISIQSSRGLPCLVIRFNPDPFKIGGVTVNVPIEERYAALCNQVKLAFSNPPSSDLVVTYMYYDDALIRTETIPFPAACVVNV